MAPLISSRAISTSQAFVISYVKQHILILHVSPADLGVLRWMYKKSREFARRMGVYRGEYVKDHPVFPEGSQATVKLTGPVDIQTPDIVYSAEDDKAIDEYSRKTGS